MTYRFHIEVFGVCWMDMYGIGNVSMADGRCKAESKHKKGVERKLKQKKEKSL